MTNPTPTQRTLSLIAATWHNGPHIYALLEKWHSAFIGPLTEEAAAFISGFIDMAAALPRVPWELLTWVLHRGNAQQRAAMTRLFIERAPGSISIRGSWPAIGPDHLPVLTEIVESSTLRIDGAFFIPLTHTDELAAFLRLALRHGSLEAMPPHRVYFRSMAAVLARLDDETFERLVDFLPSDAFYRAHNRQLEDGERVRENYNPDLMTDARWRRLQCRKLAEIAPALVQLDISVYPLFWIVRWLWPELPEYHAIRILTQTREAHRVNLAKRLKNG